MNKATGKVPLCFTVGILLAAAVCFLVPQASFAGEYHAVKEKTYLQTTETLACSQCHTMHGSQGGQSMIYGGAAAVYPALIRAATIVQLCRTCHEANSLGLSNPTPPDIWNNDTLGYTPSAGDFNDRNLTTLNEQNRHSVDSNNVTPPGGTITIPYFSCENCHDQHGNKNYRNLKLRPGNLTSDITVNYRRDGTGLCSDGSTAPCDVDYVTTTGDGVTTNLYKYNRKNVSFRKPATDTSGIARWCGGCHTNFHGAGGAANIGGDVGGDTGLTPWLRHPVRDVNIDQATTDLHADRDNWAAVWAAVLPGGERVRAINPDGSAPTAVTADEQPFCLTCHYAHGGGNPNKAIDSTSALDHTNLVFIDGSGKINIESGFNTSTGMIRNLCEQCHNQ